MKDMLITMRLRHLLIGLFSLMAMISLAAIGWHIANARERLDEMDWIDNANQISDLILRATANNGVERGLTLVLLADPRQGAARAQERERLQRLREQDARLHDEIAIQMRHLARIAATGTLNDGLRRIAQQRDMLVEARMQVDDCLAARECRISTALWKERINAHIETLAALRRTVLRPRNVQAQPFAENPLIKEITYTMTEFAGRERALVGTVIAEGRPFTPMEMAAVHGYRGIVTEALQKLDLALAQMPADTSLVARRAAMRSEYEEHFEALRQRIYAASARGAPYPLSAVQWFDAASAAIDTMLALAEQTDLLAQESIRRVQQEARREVGLHALMVTVVFVILLLTVTVVRRRAIQPLQRLEQAALTIGAGNLGQPITGFYHDELGDVATAFERMRTNLLTQMARREEAVAEAQLLLRAIEQTADLVLITDPRGIIEYVNPAFESVTGFGRNEAQGRHTRLLKSGLHDETFYRKMWSTITSGGTFHAQVTDRHKSGELIQLEESISPLRDASGAITHYVCTARDITERQRLDMHLRQSEKLASLGQLAAGMAHEINNPVSFVHSNIGSLKEYFESLLRVLEHLETHEELIAGTGEPGRAWVAEVDALKAQTDYAFLKDDIPALLAESLDGIERVRRIVQDLRDFSRAEGCQDWERVDLRAGLDSTLNIAKNEIKHRADVVREYGEMPLVECMPAQLNQVFMNLLVNAAQAMPEGRRGTITVRCGQAGDEVWVEVADDGAGIPPENLKKIFDPFFTTKPVGKGTGLGLSLSYGIVEKHHGRIEVQSQPGAGTTFRITLPIAQRRRTASPTISVPE
jgi:PAS domain S-box-containing protein